jgi:hypothetical protein
VIAIEYINDDRKLIERKRFIKARLEYRQLRRITNASLRCAINCPVAFPSEEDCQVCGNKSCRQAQENLTKYWQELDKEK